MTRQIGLGFLLGIALVLLADAAAARMGLVTGAIPTLAGPALWTTSRAAGVTAFLAVTLDVLFGLFVSTGAMDRVLPRARVTEIHRWLSTVALVLTATHALALLGDRFVRFDALAVAVPFLSAYRPAAVALGVLAAWSALVVHLSFGLRRRMGTRAWRRLHYLSFGVFAAALTHGLLAGSDSRHPAMAALYATAAALVGLLTGARVLMSIRRRGRRLSRTRSSRTSSTRS
jgi:methionine sulfoxide reductase heme-binding subunit